MRWTLNATSSLRLSAGQREATHRQSLTVDGATPMSSAKIASDSSTVNRSSVPFGIDPPTGRIGSISNALSPRANWAPRDLRDQFTGFGDDLFVTRPGDVSDPLRHDAHHLTPGRTGHLEVIEHQIPAQVASTVTRTRHNEAGREPKALEALTTRPECA
ncbi:hypothetical protein ACIBBB_25075 [Streptomyces sp. NPDC051217]|uniref:hypothetical protein n=1 Tax=Streptomyces sp. NPDC051217 TaxID=3365644 RepID=UPI0037A50AF6